MDSGNSGSFQSSSGGDEEYDSRADSISAFIHPPPPPSQLNSDQPLFDPLSNYFDPISSRPPPHHHHQNIANLEPVWSKRQRSDPSPLMALPCFGSQIHPPPHDPPSVSLTPLAETTFSTHSNGVIMRRGPSSSAAAAGAEAEQAHVVRNPKKRSRASRRAPTTVLTTDTTNFRAMVQEFTGIPSPPFPSTHFPRTSLDLFGAPSSIRSNPSPSLLRPFPQKVQQLPPPPFLSSASSLSCNNNIINCGSSTKTAPDNVIYQLPSGLGPLKQQSLEKSNLFNMQNPIFASLQQSNNAPKIQSNMGSGLHGFGLGLSGLPALISPDSNPASWGGGGGGGGPEEGDQGQFSGNFESEKGVENGAGRSEGMVETWICSSD